MAETTSGRPKIKVYIIGSLRQPKKVQDLAQKIRKLGFDPVFDDWLAAGPEADDRWRDYEKARGRTYIEALNKGFAAGHVYWYDIGHLKSSDLAILCLPAGKSGHMEVGNILGMARFGYILLDNPERWDVMYKMADGVFESFEQLKKELIKIKRRLSLPKNYKQWKKLCKQADKALKNLENFKTQLKK